MYLIMCEGPNELAIIDILLDNDALKIKRNQLVGGEAYHARQIGTSTQVKLQLGMCYGDIDVIRVGDKLSDKLTIPKDYKERIKSEKKYCTLPEIEILFIIDQGKIKEFNKVKSSTKAKIFAKEEIEFNGVRYDNSTKFFEDYYKGRVNKLIDNIVEYKRLHKSHKKDELYLADLLK